MTETETKKFGLTSYSEPAQTNRKLTREELPPIEWARLVEGDNEYRLITEPYKYYIVRFKASEEDKGFGKKIRLSAPVEDDPAVKAGFKPKERWLIGAIARKTNDIRLLDISVMVYNYLNTMEKDSRIGSPLERDINIRVTQDAGPSGYYNTTHYDKTPLSEGDLNLIETLGMDNLEKVLARYSSPLRPETVLKRMEEMGWKEGSSAPSENAEVEALPATDADEYTFTGTSQAAQA